MAAYAALLSLMTTLNNIQIHPRVSTFFDHQQIQSLHQISNLLLEFMESINNCNGGRKGEDVVSEGRIACTAHAAEDAIESHVVDQLLAGDETLLDLETQIQDMNSVKEAAMEFRGTIELKDEKSSHTVSTAKKDFMVGFDEKVLQIMDRLTGHEPDLRVVPIVGMGGIDPRINDSRGALDFGTQLEKEDHELGLKLYQTLWGRRYLIVLDDMWSVEAWERIKFFFPNKEDRSRVVITTRIWSVATPISSSSFEMNFLDDNQSWELFCVNAFLEKGCPPELEKIGKEIVRECKGLPLSIIVIGGLLRNSRSTCEYWENFARHLNSILISGNDEHCFNMLSLSYNHLPVHLKPCFLYMGIFQEDEKICVSRLIKLLVAEGFLKPEEGQTLEEVAYDYLNDLVDRNLILVDSWKWNGRIKYFKMHDLVREVCLKIGERENIFYRMRTLEIPAGINRERRIAFDVDRPNIFDALPSASLARTFLISDVCPLPFKCPLLRVLTRVQFNSHEDIPRHVNLRYLDWRLKHDAIHYKLPSSISLLWNVHTFIFVGYSKVTLAPSEIWYMRQLRHLQFDKIILPSEKVEQHDEALLPNLHTLSTLILFSFSKEVCKRIPNIKRLGIVYFDIFGDELDLAHLQNLQSLSCTFNASGRGDLLRFPSSLRKLTLDKCCLCWEDLNAIGLSLPHLEVLKLYKDAVVGAEWDCVEGAFPRLKYLLIGYGDLVKWRAESYAFFPVLEQLHLGYQYTLEKIPSGMGEIQTLVCLHVDYCSLSAAISSVGILEEQLSLGNEDLQVVVVLRYKTEEEKNFKEKVERKSFPSKNFKFDITFD